MRSMIASASRTIKVIWGNLPSGAGWLAPAAPAPRTGRWHMDMHGPPWPNALRSRMEASKPWTTRSASAFEVAAGVGQLHMPRRALEQLQPHRFLELLDRGGQRRLRQEHARGREGERTVSHHCQEAAQRRSETRRSIPSFPSGTRRVIYRLCRIIYSKYLFVSLTGILVWPPSTDHVRNMPLPGTARRHTQESRHGGNRSA